MYCVMLLVYILYMPQRLIYYIIGLFALWNTLKLLTVHEVWRKYLVAPSMYLVGGPGLCTNIKKNLFVHKIT